MAEVKVDIDKPIGPIDLGLSDYMTESHEVQTEDGYILTLLRISKKSPSTDSSIPLDQENLNSVEKGLKNKPAVLIVHGFICSAQDWLLNTPDKVLPYMLINEGYDVWLANLRGTALSSGHVSLPRGSRNYWNFSWHEIANHDIPAIINYILDVSGNQTLHYIGHSMGCTVLLVCLSLHPEYSSKIKSMVALAPAVYGNNIRNIFFKPFIPLGNLVSKINFIRARKLFGKSWVGYGKAISCKSQSDRCGSWLMKFFGRRMGVLGKTQIENERITLIARQWPSPTSCKLFLHGMQCWYSGKTRQYNYGRSGNLKIYGQASPPVYELNNIKIPVATFYSDCDELCRPEDVTELSKVLPNLIGNYGISHPDFSHFDFLLGKDVDELVYHKVIEIICKYDNS